MGTDTKTVETIAAETTAINEDSLADVSALLLAGEIPQEEFKKNPRGKPTKVFRFSNNVVLSKEQLEHLTTTLASERAKNIVAECPVTMTPDEYKALCIRMLPQIGHRMVLLGLQSTNLAHVTSVFKELSDRGFGKSVQTIVNVNPKLDLRKGWNDYDKYIDGEVVE